MKGIEHLQRYRPVILTSDGFRIFGVGSDTIGLFQFALEIVIVRKPLPDNMEGRFVLQGEGILLRRKKVCMGLLASAHDDEHNAHQSLVKATVPVALLHAGPAPM
ncbi:MAG: hypothetical protein PHN75_03890 [Syntrophales bacterium]|nr:hypothetical protein [Syntrophales bacterium]